MSANSRLADASSARRATPMEELSPPFSTKLWARRTSSRDRVALTRSLQVEYLRPVPLGQPLVAEGRVSRMRGRALYNSAELRNANGTVLARSRGKFLAIDTETMFARELQDERSKAR